MKPPEIESYRHLDQEYERALEEYQRTESAYSEATASGQPEEVLKLRYRELADSRRALDALYERLTQMRSELVHARDEASRKVLL